VSATLAVRDAEPGDAAAIAALLAQLGYGATPEVARARLARSVAGGERVLVATCEGQVLGLVALTARVTLHRERPVGQLTVLVVDEAARGAGVGEQLVAAGEAALAAAGCGTIAVTSNRARTRAHAFYQRLGYEPTSHTFRKTLP